MRKCEKRKEHRYSDVIPCGACPPVHGQYMHLERNLIECFRRSCGGLWNALAENTYFVPRTVVLHEKLVSASDMCVEVP